MTTGQLIEALKQFNPDTPVYLAKYDNTNINDLCAQYLKISNILIVGISAKCNKMGKFGYLPSVEYKDADTCIIG